MGTKDKSAVGGEAMSKIVYKYGTGHEIPNDAKYLCTQVETTETENDTTVGNIKVKLNTLVWHYYELILPNAWREGGGEG